MLYILMVADSFEESVLEELGRAANYRIIDCQHNLLIADLRMKRGKSLDDARFIHSHFPISRAAALDTKRYLEFIYKQIRALKISKKAALRIECFDINCKQGYSAKDIEVATGQRLEKDGFNIDIKAPKVLAYVILLNGRCYSGSVRLSRSRYAYIDPFRTRKERVISRAEFKIIEAFESFGIDAPKVAIDIGAAPGGWSLFLASKGAAVIAIDGAQLDYAGIRKAGVKVDIAKLSGRNALARMLKPGGIVHVKCDLDRALGHLGGVQADFLGNDINAGSMRSAQAVMKYSRLMKKGATLVMTVKCMRRNVDKYIGEVKGTLGKGFAITNLKVLPHNRQEITLLARKR